MLKENNLQLMYSAPKEKLPCAVQSPAALDFLLLQQIMQCVSI